jgi:16S rRNA (guanine(966)-N(2))-methyltransferase RsmD
MVREAIYSLIGPHRLADAIVLDLFAGSGIMALEALSRGAREAVCVESNPSCCSLINTNAARAGFADRCRAVNADVLDYILRRAARDAAVGIVFMDPPYGAACRCRETIAAIAAMGLLAPGGVLVIEHDRREAAIVELPEQFKREKERIYGRTMVTLLVRSIPECNKE